MIGGFIVGIVAGAVIAYLVLKNNPKLLDPKKLGKLGKDQLLVLQAKIKEELDKLGKK